MKKSTFYLLSFTWGLPLTIAGLITSLALLCLRKKPKRWGGCWYFEKGKGWGGLEIGITFLVSKTASEHTKNHEHGHAIQNCYLGPLMPFVVSIPSATRYWLRKFKTQKSKRLFALGLFGAFIIIASLLSLLPILTGIYRWFALPAFIVAYGPIILVWLLCHEIPQYANNTYVDYDDIWFEGQATRWGTEIVKAWEELEQ